MAESIGTIRSADGYESAVFLAVYRLSCGWERRRVRKAQRTPETAAINSTAEVSPVCRVRGW